MKPVISNQRHVTYKKREVPIFYKIEQDLMEELGLDYSGLVKTAVKQLHNSRQNKLQLI